MSNKQAKRARQAEGPYSKPQKEGTPPEARAVNVIHRANVVARRKAAAAKKIQANGKRLAKKMQLRMKQPRQN